MTRSDEAFRGIIVIHEPTLRHEALDDCVNTDVDKGVGSGYSRLNSRVDQGVSGTYLEVRGVEMERENSLTGKFPLFFI